MIKVNMKVLGVVLNCNDSIIDLDIGNGFRFEKVYYENLPGTFKEKITNGNQKLINEYDRSKLIDSNGTYFICITKDEDFQVEPPTAPIVLAVLSNENYYTKRIEEYKEAQSQYVYKVISLLHLFKKSNIDTIYMFFGFRYELGLLNNAYNVIEESVSHNILDTNVFSLSKDEVIACNNYLHQNINTSYPLLRHCIGEYVWGIKRVEKNDKNSSFITTLEMALLKKNEQMKKDRLSKRVAVLLKSEDSGQRELYEKMRYYYKVRSERTHEGDDHNLDDTINNELEDICRSVLNKYMEYINHQILLNDSLTWEQAKRQYIDGLISMVEDRIEKGVFEREVN